MPRTPAQQLLDEVLEVALVPALRQRGYRKAGRTFRRVREQCIQVVNVQVSQWSSATSLRFTLNLGVYFPALQAELESRGYRKPGAAGPTVTGCHLSERVGMLMPAGEDHWWELEAGLPREAVTAEVSAVLTGCALPWLEARQEPAARPSAGRAPR